MQLEHQCWLSWPLCCLAVSTVGPQSTNHAPLLLRIGGDQPHGYDRWPKSAQPVPRSNWVSIVCAFVFSPYLYCLKIWKHGDNHFRATLSFARIILPLFSNKTKTRISHFWKYLHTQPMHPHRCSSPQAPVFCAPTFLVTACVPCEVWPSIPPSSPPTQSLPSSPPSE